jgi:hypothetical protein
MLQGGSRPYDTSISHRDFPPLDRTAKYALLTKYDVLQDQEQR